MKRPPDLIDVGLKRYAIASSDEYPFSWPALRTLRRLPFHPAVTFFVGENGSGKSTLLEAIAVACGFHAEGGSRTFRFDTRASHSALHDDLVINKRLARMKEGYFLRAESFYNVATEIEKLDAEGIGARLTDDYGGTPLHEQSHGEAFMALMMGRLSAGGLYLLDEPEAAWSAQRATLRAGAHPRSGKDRRAIHHRHTLTHTARLSRCAYLRLHRRRRYAPGLRRNRTFPGDTGFFGKSAAHAQPTAARG